MAEHWNGGTGGKGSKPRPFSISQEEYANRWDAIFQRDLPKEENEAKPDESDTKQNQSNNH